MSQTSSLRRGHNVACRWYSQSGLTAEADSYVRHLTERGYAAPTVECYFRGVAHFAHWGLARGITLYNASGAQINQFLYEHLPHCRCGKWRCRTVGDSRAALRHMCDMLAVQRPAPDQNVSDAIAAELKAFVAHLHSVRGLSVSTCRQRYQHVLEFLVDGFAARPIDISALGPQDVRDFALQRTRNFAPGSVNVVSMSLRSYFAFKAISGVSTEALVAALPHAANWRHSGLPDALSQEEISRLLDAFDRGRPTGMRDYAITLCLLDLGLRRGEIARLQLDDIDWRAGVIAIHGKGRRIDLMPLPARTGEAIAAYLQNGRPQTTQREVFVRHRPPINSPVDPDIIREAVRRAAARCGLRQRIRGTHVFRRTLACQMVANAASFKDIADILRHRSLDTTTIYAKVDLASLRRVPLAWPGRVK